MVEMIKASLVDALKAFSILKIVKVFIEIVVMLRRFCIFAAKLNNSNDSRITSQTFI